MPGNFEREIPRVVRSEMVANLARQTMVFISPVLEGTSREAVIYDSRKLNHFATIAEQQEAARLTLGELGCDGREGIVTDTGKIEQSGRLYEVEIREYLPSEWPSFRVHIEEWRDATGQRARAVVTIVKQNKK